MLQQRVSGDVESSERGKEDFDFALSSSSATFYALFALFRLQSQNEIGSE